MGRRIVELKSLPHTSRLLAQGMVRAIGRKRQDPQLPQLVFLLEDYCPDLAQLAAYNRLCGYSLSEQVPATWLHVQTFPLQAALLASKEFPFKLAGLVHVSNTMTLHRPVGVGEKLRMTVQAEDLAPHAKGAVFHMVSRIKVGDELVWEGESTYLAPGAKVAGTPGEPLRLPVPEVAPSQQWKLSKDLGRRYADVSGDVNPIHMYPATARLFGFPRPIVQGMWTHARAVAALGALPDSYRVTVQFAKPILMPAKVSFAARKDVESWSFAVLNRDNKPHLVGTLSPE